MVEGEGRRDDTKFLKDKRVQEAESKNVEYQNQNSKFDIWICFNIRLTFEL